jgi:hypothetical protein
MRRFSVYNPAVPDTNRQPINMSIAWNNRDIVFDLKSTKGVSTGHLHQNIHSFTSSWLFVLSRPM